MDREPDERDNSGAGRVVEGDTQHAAGVRLHEGGDCGREAALGQAESTRVHWQASYYFVFVLFLQRRVLYCVEATVQGVESFLSQFIFFYKQIVNKINLNKLNYWKTGRIGPEQ